MTKLIPQSTAPKVGVLVPCYNLGGYVEEALRSLFDQTFQDFDLVIVDDGSTDPATIKTLQSLELPRGSIVFEKQNLGLVNLVNKYIAKFKNEYYFVLSSDDKMKPTLLEELVTFLEDNKDVGAVCAWMELFGTEDGISEFSNDTCKLPEMLVENNFCGSSLVRKTVWSDVGKYDPSPFLKPHEDWVFWLSVLSKGYKLAVIPRALFCYRVLPSSTSHSVTREQNLEFRKQLLRKFLELYKEHCEYLLSRDWDIIERYDQDFIEYQAGHDWLDAEYKKQLKELKTLRTKVDRLERHVGTSLARKIKRVLGR